MTIELEESDRQMVLLSLALCSLLRPGFRHACELIAGKCGGELLFTEFRRLNADQTFSRDVQRDLMEVTKALVLLTGSPEPETQHVADHARQVIAKAVEAR